MNKNIVYVNMFRIFIYDMEDDDILFIDDIGIDSFLGIFASIVIDSGDEEEEDDEEELED
jgi:hypothetical protein